MGFGKVEAATAVRARASTDTAKRPVGPNQQQPQQEVDCLGLSLYEDAPNAELSVREFEEMTCNRLKLLHAIDRHAGYDMSLRQVASELRGKLKPMLAELQLDLPVPPFAKAAEATFLQAKEEFCRRDATSHYALRLAFCKTREARDWLVRQEQRLFVMRFEGLQQAAQEAFLRKAAVRCRKLRVQTQAEKQLLEELQKATPDAKIWRESNGRNEMHYETVFYQMPFNEVNSSLVGGRKVVIKKGMAYVVPSAIKLIISQKFKDRLNAGLDTAFQGLPVALANPQIGGFLRLLAEHGMQLLVAPKSNVDSSVEKLSLPNFEELMVRSFPPCMRRLVEQQRQMKKHLKHAGRLQLRPFLKECGFTMEESLQWWKQELCADPEIDATVYEKNYTYDVEHTYGKKGHLQGQNAFGCPKLIGFPLEATGQVHGCPFRHMEMPQLKQMLHRWRLPQENMKEAEQLINQGKHYQLACIEYFKGMHPGHEGEGVGNSPGDFFRESCRCHNKKLEKESSQQSPSKP